MEISLQHRHIRTHWQQEINRNKLMWNVRHLNRLKSKIGVLIDNMLNNPDVRSVDDMIMSWRNHWQTAITITGIRTHRATVSNLWCGRISPIIQKDFCNHMVWCVFIEVLKSEKFNYVYHQWANDACVFTNECLHKKWTCSFNPMVITTKLIIIMIICYHSGTVDDLSGWIEKV